MQTREVKVSLKKNFIAIQFLKFCKIFLKSVNSAKFLKKVFWRALVDGCF